MTQKHDRLSSLSVPSGTWLVSDTWLLGGIFWRAVSAASLVSLLAVGCGGSTPPAEEPSDDGTAVLAEPEEEEVAPTSAEVKRASDLIKQQKFDEAAEILAKETQASPEDPQAAFFYGVALEGTGKHDQAEAQYRRAIKLDPKLIEASQNLSAVLLTAEKNDEALKVTEAALQYAPKDTALLANRAIALDMLGRPEAVGAYEQLLEIKPDDQANRFNYAVALYLNKRFDEAKSQLSKIRTTDIGLLSDIEKLYVEMKDFPGCIRTWDTALAADKTAEGLTHRARCKLMAGDKASAENDLKDALAAEPKSPIAHFYYGKLLQKDGKTAEAKTHFQAALEADPTGPFGQAAKAEL